MNRYIILFYYTCRMHIFSTNGSKVKSSKILKLVKMDNFAQGQNIAKKKKK